MLEEPGVSIDNVIPAVFGTNRTLTSMIVANVTTMDYNYCSFYVLLVTTFESDVNVTLFSQIININRYLDIPKLPSLELKVQRVLDGVVFETVVYGSHQPWTILTVCLLSVW